MAGHNKWSTIKQRKGKEDARRAKEFTKIARMIAVACKEGGSDPEYNPSLKAAIDKAKAANMPNDNIDRAIKKASGAGEADHYEEITYEGYGPEGVAVIVHCLTDNKNRTASDVRHAFDKFGGNLGTTGSVSFMFDYVGLLTLDPQKNPDLDEDTLMLEAVEAGAEDVRTEGGFFEVVTAREDFNEVRNALADQGRIFDFADLTYLPQNLVAIQKEDNIKNIIKMLEALEDSDDIQEVYHNWDVPDDLELD